MNSFSMHQAWLQVLAFSHIYEMRRGFGPSPSLLVYKSWLSYKVLVRLLKSSNASHCHLMHSSSTSSKYYRLMFLLVADVRCHCTKQRRLVYPEGANLCLAGNYALKKAKGSNYTNSTVHDSLLQFNVYDGCDQSYSALLIAWHPWSGIQPYVLRTQAETFDSHGAARAPSKPVTRNFSVSCDHRSSFSSALKSE
jgi:hypothetical protein